MNSRIVGVEDADVLLLVGTDLKQEAPVLNSRVLKATRKNKLKVYSIGTPSDQTFDYNHLGVSAKIVEQIASGSHPFAETLKKAKLPMIIAGANALERVDGEVKSDLSLSILGERIRDPRVIKYCVSSF